MTHPVNPLLGRDQARKAMVSHSAARAATLRAYSTTLDNALTQDAGGFVMHVLGLVLAVALAGFLYRRRIFLRV